MHKLRTILPAALALALAPSAPHGQAQLTPLQDPANLAGERVSPQDPADTLPLNHGAPALQQLLAKLRTRASLMLIVAHPDDEDGGLLTYESRGQGARVAMLTLTRGEGGQNLMSADFDDALGLIRTQELLAADRYFGVDQFFGTEVDFGFSKTKEESFAKWTHERVLYDAVRAVRLYRPLVIASVFVGGPTDGHGQHQVAGEIAQEVFLAAADPKVFPEMNLPVWAPLKVYARVPFSRVTPEGMYDYATGKTIPTRFRNYVTGVDTTTVPSATVLIHEGDIPTDPTLAAAMGGDTFVQYARRGLALQKTQIGPNVRLAPPGRSDTGYTLMASRLACITTKAGCPILSDSGKGGVSGASPTALPTTEQSLFDGIDTSLPGIAGLALTSPIPLRALLETIDQKLAEAQKTFDPANLEASANQLREALRKLDSLLSILDESQFGEQNAKANILHELHIKRAQLNSALLLTHGLTLTATLDPAAQPLLTGRASASVKLTMNNPGIRKLILLPESYSATELPRDSSSSFFQAVLEQQRTLNLPSGLSATRPYFSRPNLEQPFYDISDPTLRNAPVTPDPLVISQLLDDNGARLLLETTVLQSPPTLGTPSQAAVIVPLLSVGVSPSIGVASVRSAQKVPFAFNVMVRTNTLTLRQPRIELDWPKTWQVRVAPDDFTLSSIQDIHSISVRLSAPIEETKTLLRNPQIIHAYAVDPVSGDISSGYRPVGYPGIPYTNFYTPATYRATAVDVTTAPHLRIAYLPGTGDTVPDFLPNLGITPTVLTLKDLTPANLKQYDAVLLGVRAYAAHPEIAGPGSQPLLDYAKSGGVVIVQYNTARYGDAEVPFPLAVPGDPAHNVVEEAQPVTLLQPANPLLIWPNKITAADFDHWVAERGHGFAASWSSQYEPLLETHDIGQDPQQGGLLLARTGKGTYIYCALALYRQLPEGVPGAYRLLANLLSYAKNPAR